MQERDGLFPSLVAILLIALLPALEASGQEPPPGFLVNAFDATPGDQLSELQFSFSVGESFQDTWVEVTVASFELGEEPITPTVIYSQPMALASQEVVGPGETWLFLPQSWEIRKTLTFTPPLVIHQPIVTVGVGVKPEDMADGLYPTYSPVELVQASLASHTSSENAANYTPLHMPTLYCQHAPVRMHVRPKVTGPPPAPVTLHPSPSSVPFKSRVSFATDHMFMGNLVDVDPVAGLDRIKFTFHVGAGFQGTTVELLVLPGEEAVPGQAIDATKLLYDAELVIDETYVLEAGAVGPGLPAVRSVWLEVELPAPIFTAGPTALVGVGVLREDMRNAWFWPGFEVDASLPVGLGLYDPTYFTDQDGNLATRLSTYRLAEVIGWPLEPLDRDSPSFMHIESCFGDTYIQVHATANGPGQ